MNKMGKLRPKEKKKKGLPVVIGQDWGHRDRGY